MRKPMLLLLCLALMALAQDKKRIAVMAFDSNAVNSSAAQVFGSGVDAGQGIAAMLIDRLNKGRAFAVVERREIDQVVSQQNLGYAGRNDPATAAKIGKMLSLGAIVVGSLDQFGRDERNQNQSGASSVNSVTGRLGLGGLGVPSSGTKKEWKAVVQITARLIDVNTGEVLGSAAGRGESKKSGASMLGTGGGNASAGAGIDMSSANFPATLIGEASTEAIAECAAKLEAIAAKVPSAALDGLIADVNGNSLVLNIGKIAGLKVGDKLIVMQTGREIKDPATGRVLRRLDTQIGEVTLTDVDDGSSVGTFAGQGAPKVGDHVKR